MSARRAWFLYLALTVPLGAAVHIVAEFAGLGDDALPLSISVRHVYLGLIALAALGAFAATSGLLAGRHERRLRFSALARALPFEGRGAGFLLLTALLQFGFFYLTQFAEGCPLCGGDLWLGIAAALLASLAGAFALFALRARYGSASCSCDYCRRPRVPPAHAPTHWGIIAARTLFERFAFATATRPPPLLFGST